MFQGKSARVRIDENKYFVNLCFLYLDVPRQQCKMIPEKKCKTVPQQKCKTIMEQQCTNVPKKKCENVPRQECRGKKAFLTEYV